MRITNIHVTHHRLTMTTPFPANWDTVPRTKHQFVLVRVETDQGVTGIAGGDSIAPLEPHLDLFVGQDPRFPERLYPWIENISFYRDRCWLLDLALWDAAAKIAEQPLWQFLGGRTNKLQLYASMGTGVLSQQVAPAHERALDRQERGFRAIKLRCTGREVAKEIAALEKTRAAVGDDMAIMVDLNKAWRMPWDAEFRWDRKSAERFMDAARDIGLYWVEEPLHHSDFDGMRLLREKFTPRIAGGEMNRPIEDFATMLRMGSVDVVQGDVALTCGISGHRRVAGMAELCHAVWSPHTWGCGLAMLANLQAAAGLSAPPFTEYPLELPGWDEPVRDFMFAEPIVAKDGCIELPDRPGIGYDLDEDRLQATRL
ncbi:MAG: mandelate racemase/muconate lactonizing enzyme family protein [Alphaproteobacteria bacterium]|nr:mandelate racemase/muconate lactonizing enzyme family protein [Alphaproteobacteria bacterium]